MRRIAFLLVAVATLASVIAYMVPASGQEAQNSAPVYVTKIPSGYRDWRLISVAHEEGNLHSFAAVLGNDVAIKAYREQKLPFPDGAIIAALHYSHIPSEENNKVFGREQSFVPGPPTNIQFMVKDSKKYAATGGWGSGTSTQMAKLATRRYSRLALPATRRLLAILSSRVTHLNNRFVGWWLATPTSQCAQSAWETVSAPWWVLNRGYSHRPCAGVLSVMACVGSVA